MMFVVAGCDNEEKDDYAESYATAQTIDFSTDGGESFVERDDNIEDYFDILNEEEVEYVFFIAQSYSELQEKISENKSKVNYSENDFKEKFSKYDKKFFKKHMLLYYYRLEPKVISNYVHSIKRKV